MSPSIHYTVIFLSHQPQTYKNKENIVILAFKLHRFFFSPCIKPNVLSMHDDQLNRKQVVFILYSFFFPLACAYVYFFSVTVSVSFTIISWVKCINGKITSTTTTIIIIMITLLVEKTSPSLFQEGFRSGYKRERAHLEKSSTAPVYYSIPKISLSVTLKISSEGKKWSKGSYK